jgi:hypothetical protein
MVKRVMLAFLIGTFLTPAESVPAMRRAQRGSQLAQTGVPQDPSSIGYLNLHKRHPDGAEGPEEFNSAYAPDVALQSLTRIQNYLVSFRRLTDRVRSSLNEVELRAIGNTSGDTQTIGFQNIPLSVEGTILKQNYQLRQAQYELAQLRRTRGDISVQDLNRARSAYAQATKRFQVFWDTRLPGN